MPYMEKEVRAFLRFAAVSTCLETGRQCATTNINVGHVESWTLNVSGIQKRSNGPCAPCRRAFWVAAMRSWGDSDGYLDVCTVLTQGPFGTDSLRENVVRWRTSVYRRILGCSEACSTYIDGRLGPWMH
jgi:hypothetical protein